MGKTVVGALIEKTGGLLSDPLTKEQLKRAAIITADNSTCTDDCANLLDILGIDLQEIWS